MSIQNQTPPKKKIFEHPNPYLPLMKSISIPKITDHSKMEASVY
jgi:hypothetical protein